MKNSAERTGNKRELRKFVVKKIRQGSWKAVNCGIQPRDVVLPPASSTLEELRDSRRNLRSKRGFTAQSESSSIA